MVTWKKNKDLIVNVKAYTCCANMLHINVTAVVTSTHLDELRVHQLGRTHTRPLVHLAVIDQLLAAIHRLIV